MIEHHAGVYIQLQRDHMPADRLTEAAAYLHRIAFRTSESEGDRPLVIVTGARR